MRTKESWFPKFKPHTGNLETPVQIDEYLPSGKSIVLGLQHAFAMFGATVLAPLLMGFDPNLTILLLVLVPSCSFNYRWAYAQLSRIKLRLYWCSRCRHRLCRGWIKSQFSCGAGRYNHLRFDLCMHRFNCHENWNCMD